MISNRAYLENFKIWSREQGCYPRGACWVDENPEPYGICRTGMKLPSWSEVSLGYDCGQSCFSAYPEGDWYDGIEHGAIDIGLVHKLNEKSMPFKTNEGLLFWKRDCQWVVYKGDGLCLSCWLEFRLGEELKKGQIITCEELSDDEVSTAFQWEEKQQNNQIFMRNRLMIYLNNTHITQYK